MDGEEWFGCIGKALIVLLFILGIADGISRCENKEKPSTENTMDDDESQYRERWDGRNSR